MLSGPIWPKLSKLTLGLSPLPHSLHHTAKHFKSPAQQHLHSSQYFISILTPNMSTSSTGERPSGHANPNFTIIVRNMVSTDVKQIVYRGHGAGTKILRWGMEKARSLRRFITVISDATSMPWYERHGFQKLDTLVVQAADDDQKITLWAMFWDPAGKDGLLDGLTDISLKDPEEERKKLEHEDAEENAEEDYELVQREDTEHEDKDWIKMDSSLDACMRPMNIFFTFHERNAS
ncbi:hypothetical protein QBC40DRAFT_349846 [Triangularia verruculosa]|uniref:Uncharacterized protein n=1 Tax=Triangularia verruculosa TaxID=2587418 RepID=A0AAN6XDP4_9PEZI|nr:hypothetical protein QBC40DRAFT_349846 [Triangularia verruculosa]